MKIINSLFLLFGLFFFMMSCDTVEDLTEIKKTFPEIPISDVITVELEDSDEPGFRLFAGSETIKDSTLLQKYINQKKKIKSVTIEKVTIQLEVTDGTSDGYIVKDFTLECPENGKIYSIDTYNAGEIHSSEKLKEFTEDFFRKLLTTETVTLKYKGKTNVPGGKKIKHSFKLHGVQIRGNAVDF